MTAFTTTSREAVFMPLLGALVGFLLGYSYAYIGRFVQLLFLDAILIGLFGGALLLFVALIRHINFARWLSATCVTVGLMGWLGMQAGEHRIAKRVFARMGDPISQETASGDTMLELSEKAEALSEGWFPYAKWRAERGLMITRVGPRIARVKIPAEAVFLTQALSMVLAIFLCWLVLRRLGWVEICPETGRFIPIRRSDEEDEEMEYLGDIDLEALEEEASERPVNE